jgi:hypothetical protein
VFQVYSIGIENPGNSDSAEVKIAIEKNGYIITEDKELEMSLYVIKNYI